MKQMDWCTHPLCSRIPLDKNMHTGLRAAPVRRAAATACMELFMSPADNTGPITLTSQNIRAEHTNTHTDSCSRQIYWARGTAKEERRRKRRTEYCNIKDTEGNKGRKYRKKTKTFTLSVHQLYFQLVFASVFCVFFYSLRKAFSETRSERSFAKDCRAGYE